MSWKFAVILVDSDDKNEGLYLDAKGTVQSNVMILVPSCGPTAIKLSIK